MNQFVAVQAQRFDIVAVEIDFPLVVLERLELAVPGFEAVAEGGLGGGNVDLPLKVRAIGEQGLAQVDAFGRSIDGVLIDPGTVEVFRAVAGAAAQQGGEQRQGERVAHGGGPCRGGG
ncbi:hypothetical protein D3C80_1790780 [compost metagenome]